MHVAPVVGWGGRNRCILHNVDYDPGPWRQTLRLLPPGIEPGSHALKAGTLPKELSRELIPVLRIRDVYPGCQILIFSYPGSPIQKQLQKRGVKKNLLS